MKLKTAVILETISWWITIILRIPFAVIAHASGAFSNTINNFQNWVAYKLCRRTKEFDMVKDEGIRNSRYFGAVDLHEAIEYGLI